MKKKLAVVAFTLSACAIACQLVAGIERVEKVDLPPDSGLLDGGQFDATPRSCVLALPPSKPALDASPTSGETNEVLYLGVRSLTLEQDGGSVPGFDLDGVCDCDEGEISSCGSAFAKPGSLCDVPGLGVDNQLLRIYEDFKGYVPDFEQQLSSNINRGLSTLIISISRYNGLDNDVDVSVGFAIAAGLVASDCGSESIDAGPGWCGRDRWNISNKDDNTYPGNPYSPRVSATSAYVSNRRLVVRVDKDVKIPFGSYGLPIGSSVWSAELVRSDNFWTLTGTVGGRLQIPELFAGIGSIQKDEKVRLCSDSKFSTYRQVICDQRDIGLERAQDSKPGNSCEAMSAAVGFTANSILPGVRVTPPADENLCALSPAGDGPILGPAGLYACPK